MSLKEAIERRRKADEANNPMKQDNAAPIPSNNDHKVDEQTSHTVVLPLALRLFWNGNRRSSIPWGCYQGADYLPCVSASDGVSQYEQIQMTFMRHEVLVRGKNLEPLMDAIDGLRLVELREIPEKLHSGADMEDGEPVILKINIKKAGC